MNPLELQRMIKGDVDKLMKAYHSFFRENNLESFEGYQESLIGNKADDLLSCVANLINAKTKESISSAALGAYASLSSLNAQLSYLTAQMSASKVINQISQAVSNAWQSLLSTLQSLIQSVSGQLGQLISSMTNPTGWSITESVGVSLFGVTGNSEIQVTFS